MRKFKIGNHVIATAECDRRHEYVGCVGKVVELGYDQYPRTPVLVRWYNSPAYKNWWCEDTSLELDTAQRYMEYEQ